MENKMRPIALDTPITTELSFGDKCEMLASLVNSPPLDVRTIKQLLTVDPSESLRLLQEPPFRSDPLSLHDWLIQKEQYAIFIPVVKCLIGTGYAHHALTLLNTMTYEKTLYKQISDQADYKKQIDHLYEVADSLCKIHKIVNGPKPRTQTAKEDERLVLELLDSISDSKTLQITLNSPVPYNSLQPLLHLAVYQRWTTALRTYLPSFDLKSRDIDGNSYVHMFATSIGTLDTSANMAAILKPYLIKKTAGLVNEPNDAGNTPLASAIDELNLNPSLLLVQELGADKKLDIKGFSPLKHAFMTIDKGLGSPEFTINI